MWKVEVVADDSGKWCGNGVRFATKEEAETYARNLSWRWLAVRKWRAVQEEETKLSIAKITRAYVRHYRDNGQTTAYVEWVDHKGNTGRTKGSVCRTVAGNELGTHMRALFTRAEREGISIEHQEW